MVQNTFLVSEVKYFFVMGLAADASVIKLHYFSNACVGNFLFCFSLETSERHLLPRNVTDEICIYIEFFHSITLYYYLHLRDEVAICID